MGLRFRRSFKILPGVRVNLSGSGTSLSLGPRGFHYTVGSKGTRVTAGIPGTGLSWSQYTPHAKPRSDRLPIAERPSRVEAITLDDEPVGSGLTGIENGSAKEINAFSTSELAPLLDSANRRFRFASLTLLVSILLFVAALLYPSRSSMLLSAFYGAVFVPAAVLLDRYRRSVKVIYEPQGAAAQISFALADSFKDLMACNAIWSIGAEGRTADWKRNAGATKLSIRKKAYARFDKPNCIRGKSTLPSMKLGADEVYFLPDAALVLTAGSVAAVHYQDLEVLNSMTKFIEEERVPADSPIIDHTWRYINKKGGPDRRFNSNKELPVCLYGELSLRSSGGLNCKIHYSNPDAAGRLCKVIEVLHQAGAELPRAISYIKTPGWGASAAFLLCAAVFAGLQFAFLPNAFVSRNAQPPASVDRIRDTPIIPQPVTVQPSGRVEQKSAREDKLMPLTLAPPLIARSTENTATRPVVESIPLPRPRPKQ